MNSSPRNDASLSGNIDEAIGPWQLVDNQLWLGRSFYQGEGQSGVGEVGYFSPDDASFHLFSDKAIADWSTTALLVEADAVWTSLESLGEYGPRPGGIVRFDRQTKTFESLTDRGGIGRQFLRVGGHLLLMTDTGVTVVRDHQVEHYIVDRTTDGRLRIAESLR